ncbi:MAG TPA: acetate uptake transporter [Ktedonosporobacter sp.]|nr:acetate uptake transporter [Ktedonosporobacter sp.]
MAQFAAESGRAATPAATGANPAPLGLSGFALTTFVLSTINAGWFPAASAEVVVALALFYGGLAQFMAGMWEFRAGNTFGATAFSSFGAFWLSYAAILIPGTGIVAGLGSALHSALGIYLLAWAIFTFLMFLGTFRLNVALMALFGFLTLTFLFLALGELIGSGFALIGGYLGIITALIAWYTALAGVLSAHNGIFSLPVWPRT